MTHTWVDTGGQFTNFDLTDIASVTGVRITAVNDPLSLDEILFIGY